MAVTVKKYFPDYRIYKPKKDGTGAASKFQLKITDEKFKNVQLFWVGAQQKDKDDSENAQFAWEDKDRFVTIKLGLPDLGEILTVLKGIKSEAGQAGKGIYHKNKSGDSSITFKKYKPPTGDAMFTVRLSKKVNGKMTEVKHSLTLAEGAVLETLLTQALLVFTGWL